MDYKMIDKQQLKGIYPALITPFKEDGSVNFDSMEKVIEMNLKKGVTGFYVNGSSAECFLLSKQERSEIYKFVAKVNAGRGVLIAHVGAMDTATAVDYAKIACNSGYDVISSVPPAYYSYSVEEIKNYYSTIMAATPLPVLLYNFPATGTFSLTQDFVKDLCEIHGKKLIGIKHTSSNLYDLERFKNLPYNLTIFNGYDEMLIGGLAMGADGGIGSTYNLMSEKILRLYNAFNEGRIKDAQKEQFEINDIIYKLIKYGIFSTIKEVLTLKGIPCGACRSPFKPISEEGKKEMKKIAEILG